MKSLYLRIWLTVVAALALFALVSAWIVDRHLAQERAAAESRMSERLTGWGELIQNSLPEADAPRDAQAQALREWSERLRLPLALDDARGRRIAESESFREVMSRAPEHLRRVVPMHLDDGRTLTMLRFVRPDRSRGPGGGSDGGTPPERLPHAESPAGPGDRGGPPRGFRPERGEMPPDWRMPLVPADWPAGVGLLVLLALLFLAVAAGAWPVVRHLTRRLEALKQGVERFGAGNLSHRVAEEGADEVAAVATSFNQAAGRIEALLRANQSLLANASHELRSPLARLKMAVTLLLDDAPASMRDSLAREIRTNIAELDALVEEVLLSSRLEAGAPVDLNDPVDLLAVVAEEGARVHAQVDGDMMTVRGSERLLRRAVRNLLENARRYGGEDVSAVLDTGPAGALRLRVCDRGAGVPPDECERIFEPFYRMVGHAEREGGVGLGLALVRQIARRHGGDVHCEAREGGGSCFVLTLPGTRRVAG